jgi:hypothetical protein
MLCTVYAMDRKRQEVTCCLESGAVAVCYFKEGIAAECVPHSHHQCIILGSSPCWSAKQRKFVCERLEYK